MFKGFNLESYQKEYKIETVDKIIFVIMGLCIVYSSYLHVGAI